MIASDLEAAILKNIHFRAAIFWKMAVIEGIHRN